MYHCEFCGKDVDINDSKTWTRKVGWMQGTGKSPRVALTSDPMGFAHDVCVDERVLGAQRGWTEASDSLF